MKLFLDGENLTFEDIENVARKNLKVAVSPAKKAEIKSNRHFLEDLLSQEQVIYGINTGFGRLNNIKISDIDLETLQRNLILSHCAGVGDPLPLDCIRAIILIRANTLVKGYSGVRLKLIEALLDLLNFKIHPLIPSHGSVGASGDLAPLAHLAAVLIGEGEVFCSGKKMNAGAALKSFGLLPFKLAPKEGLALINGTCLMSALGVLILQDFFLLLKMADIISTATLEALEATDAPFHPLLHKVREHCGQKATAYNISLLINGFKTKNINKVQDAYSLRCIPQVHGAAKESAKFADSIFKIEINSATDNPLIFSKEKLVLTGGNFHGAPLALALDLLAIGLSYLANISERRIDKLLTAYNPDLPVFLTSQGGLNSGLMITQYTAASLVSENKVLAHPASVDSIPTSGGFEDHVSMGATSAFKLLKILKNTQDILAVELLCAIQALDYINIKRVSRAVKIVFESEREKIPALKSDRLLYKDINTARKIIAQGELVKKIEKVIGGLKLN
ncbi:MAG: histidine ammonia-lyase [Armatimonadetes bacterium]|nr:histidine ammonia-lyase [Armatimonadota bacterium]